MSSSNFFLFFFNDTATTEIYTLSLHDALPIWSFFDQGRNSGAQGRAPPGESSCEFADLLWELFQRLRLVAHEEIKAEWGPGRILQDEDAHSSVGTVSRLQVRVVASNVAFEKIHETVRSPVFQEANQFFVRHQNIRSGVIIQSQERPGSIRFRKLVDLGAQLPDRSEPVALSRTRGMAGSGQAYAPPARGSRAAGM